MVIKNEVFIRKSNGEYVELPWYVLEPQAFGSPALPTTIRRRAVNFQVGVGPEAGREIKPKAKVIPLPLPQEDNLDPKLKKDRRLAQHKGKFTIGAVWTQNVINGEVGYNINTERKLRFHADKIGLDHADLGFLELLKILGKKLAEDA